MANEFTIPEILIVGSGAAFGELERQSTSIANEIEAVNDSGDASIGIFSSATGVGAYNFGTGVTANSASVSYNHNTTQMIFDIDGTDELIIDVSGGTTVTTLAADMVITGDLTVNGTTTTINTTNLEITDNKILLNDGETGPGVSSGVSGLEIDRGPATENTCWVYDDVDNWWEPRDVSNTAGSLPGFKIIGNLEEIDTTTADNILIITGSGAIKIPAGNTAARPSSPVNGMVRYSSTLNNLEGYINGNWEELLNTGSSVTISGDLTMDTGAQFFLDDGTLADPGLAFSDDVNTGIFSAIDNSIGLVANGSELLRIGPTEIDAFANLDMNDNVLFGVANPSGGSAGSQVGDQDFNDARYVNITGDNMTSNLEITDVGEALTLVRTGTEGSVASFAVDLNTPGTEICIQFKADNDLNASIRYGEICVEITDNSNGSEDAKMNFNLLEAGGIATLATLEQDPAGTGGLMTVTATAALYSDLAERYAADMDLEPGTVVVFGGEAEITMSSLMEDTAVAGVISTAPAFRMNSKAGENKTHPYVALKGRVPCKVTGPIKKGDLLVTATLHGHAMSAGKRAGPYTAFARALENFDEETGVIEVAII